MRRHLFLLMLTYLALILDAGQAAWALPDGTSPQFLLMCAGIALLLCKGAGAIVWAAVIGVLCDSLSPAPPGLNVVLLVNLAFFAQGFGMRSLRDSAFAGGAAVWIFVTLASLGSLLLQHLLQGVAIDLHYLALYAAGRAGASTAIFVAIVLTSKGLLRSLRFLFGSARVGDQRRGWATNS